MALSRRGSVIAWATVAVAPLPLLVAILVTARPVYSEDACFYGPTAAEIRATDDYLHLTASLAMFGLAAAVTVLARLKTERWRVWAVAFFAWAALTFAWTPASHPVMYPGGLVAVFGIFVTAPVLIVAAAAAQSSGAWLRMLAWLESLYVIPVLLGLAKILAQPSCLASLSPGFLPGS